MPRITEYPLVTEMANDDVFIIDGENGTRRITKEDMLSELTNNIAVLSNRIRGVSFRRFYYGTSSVQVPMNLPDHTNTMLIVSGEKIGTFRINSDGSMSTTSADISATYNNGNLEITNGNWYTSGIIIASWNNAFS